MEIVLNPTTRQATTSGEIIEPLAPGRARGHVRADG
jgi:hypothetical protein